MSSARAAAFLAACLLAAAFAAGAGAEEPSFALGGAVTERAFASWAAAGGAAFDPAAIAYGQAACLELGLDAAGPEGGLARASARASADLLVRSGAATAAGGTTSPALDARLRELYARLDSGPAFATLGRSIFNYGRCAAFSPVDIFAEYDKSGPAPLRLGADALRLGAAFGATGLAEAVAAPPASGTALSDGRYALRASGLAGPVDLGALGAWEGEAGAWLAGLDFKADAIAGIYGEALCIVVSGDDARYRAALGADWSLGLGPGKLVARAEYCYDGLPLGGGGEAALALPCAPDSHNAYAALAWAADRASVQASATCAWPGGAAQASLAASFDAARGAQALLYASAARSAAGAAYAEAGASLSVSF